MATCLAIFKQKIDSMFIFVYFFHPDGFHETDPTRTVQRSAFCRSRRELSNAYFLAKFGFDTAENDQPASQPAENEPCKVCPLSVYKSPRSKPGSILAFMTARSTSRKTTSLRSFRSRRRGQRPQSFAFFHLTLAFTAFNLLR